MKHLLYIFIFISSFGLNAQTDSLFIASIYKEALTKGDAHENLRSLCKDIGARLTGSAEAEMAVVWGKNLLESYDFDVRLQEVMVPHWERGTAEVAWIVDANNTVKKIKVLALGGSIGTNGLLEGDIVEVKSIADLNAKGDALKGKIVFINQKMDATQIRTFNAYGMCYPIRGNGASEAARYGAKAVIIRSLAMPVDNHPHTGTLRYNEEFDKIPAAAISTSESQFLSEALLKGEVKLKLEMDCRRYEDKISYNVIGEWKGKTDKIITVGGHLDSWDVGEGAHDDGAGIVHSIESLRLLKELGYEPNNTLRVVLFMNEENGNMGGETYAKKGKELGEKHIIAIESDRGGFAPRGFAVDGSDKDLELMRSFSNDFKPYDLHYFEKGFGGVDIGPLRDHFKDISMFGFVPDSQRYFDFHHSEADVFENVNKRELELGAASIAALIYLLDKK